MPVPTNTINKVTFGGDVLIDLTGDTITADKILSGYTAHDRTGAQITGTHTGRYKVGFKTATVGNSNAQDITFSALSGSPVYFACQLTTASSGGYNSGASTKYITSIISEPDGTGTVQHYSSIYKSSNNTREYYYTGENTINIQGGGSIWAMQISSPNTTTPGYFKASCTYNLMYIYE